MFNRFKSKSIRSQLSAFMLFMLLPLLTFQAIELYDRYRILYRHELQANLEMAHATRAMFVGYVNSVVRSEAALLNGVDFDTRTPEDIAGILSAFKHDTHYFEHVSWLDADGKVVASSRGRAIGMDLSESAYVHDIRQGRTWSISDLFIDPVSASPAFVICSAVRDERGLLRGILAGSIDEERLQKEISFERSRTAGIMILDRNGRMVVRSPRIELSWDERNLAARFPYVRAALNGREGVVTRAVGIDGTNRIIANIPMPFGWVAGAGCSESEVTGVIWDHLSGRVILFVSMLATGLLAAAVVSRQITRNVVSLRERSDAIARGDYIPRSEMAKSKDFQVLAESLDAMSRKVREREADLRKSEERFRALVSASSQIIFCMSPDCMVMRPLGSGGREAADSQIPQAQWLDRFVHPDDRARVSAAIGDAVGSGSILKLEHRARRADGSFGWMLSRAVPLVDGNGTISEWFGSCSDITDRKQAEEDLFVLNAKLESTVKERTANLTSANRELARRAEQLRLLAGELTMAEQRERKRLASVLHDGLQQYLVAAKMQVGGLVEDLDSRQLRQTAAGVERMLKESIAVSRSLAAELSPPILHDAGILAALGWLARWMADKHRLQVKLTFDMDPPALNDDVKVLLFEAVRELLLNVVKHARTSSAGVHLSQKDERLRLTVADDGAGFDCAGMVLGEAFSTGFGLFSIRERIELAGGRFEIDSSPGWGSRLTLVVPLESAAVRANGRPDQPAIVCTAAPDQPGPCKTRVLLCDDHAVVREGLAGLLTQEPDLEVIGQACDGQEAIALADALQPDVILMDVSMPRMNGIDATRHIHRQHPEIRIIGLSLYTEDERATAMLDAGASLYMSKTVPAPELKQAIRAYSGENNTSDVLSGHSGLRPER